MAKPKYEFWRTERGLGEIQEICEGGLTDRELAAAMKISYSTLQEWLKKFPEIRDAAERGRGGARVQIENALFQRAMGGYRTVKKPVKRRVREYDPETRRCIREEEIYDTVDEEIYIPPDTAAIKFFLTNRGPKRWSNRVELQGDARITMEDLLGDG